MSNREGDARSWEFLSICPRAGDYMQSMFRPLRLRVVQDSGVDTTPDIDIVVNDLASGRKMFQNNSGKCDSFKVDVLIKDTDVIQYSQHSATHRYPILGSETPGELVSYFWLQSDLTEAHLWTVLDYFARNLTPLNVVTRAVDVPDGLYVITDNSSRKQEYEGMSIWTLEFTKYEEINTTTFINTSAGAEKAIKKYQAAKAKKDAKKKQKTTVKTKTTPTQNLKKCKLSKLVYSKKKKSVACVKSMQKILNFKIKSNLVVDGWYGDATLKAVKNFQTKNKKYGLKVNGKVDQNTLNCLVGKCGQIGKTTKVKGKLPATTKKAKSPYAKLPKKVTTFVDMTKKK